MTPPCFDSDEQWQQWHILARFTNLHRDLARSGHCVDCTPEYQDRMLKEQRCEHPETTFVGEGTALRGFRPLTLPPDVRRLRLSPTCTWVSNYLMGGPKLVADVLNDAWAAGHSKERTREALKTIKATRFKLTVNGVWFYTLPSTPVPKGGVGGTPGA